MDQIRRTTSTPLLSAMVLGAIGLVLVVPGIAAAEPAGDGCARYSELRQVEKGMSRARVERIFGTTRSRLANGAAGGYSRAYLSCDEEHEAIVEFAVPRRGATPRATGFKRWLRV